MKSCIAFLLFAATLAAGPANKPGDNLLAVLSDAVSKGRAGDTNAAAEAAGQNNDAGRGTIAWHQQSSVELLKYAYLLRAQLRFDESKQAATVGVNVMTDGLNRYGKNASASERAEAYDQIGQAYEDLIGDLSSALQNYSAALGENAIDDKAKGALRRAKEQTDSLQRAAKNGGHS